MHPWCHAILQRLPIVGAADRKLLLRSRFYLLPSLGQHEWVNSIDEHPWEHPFLTVENIERFRVYSEQVWQVALDHQQRYSRPLRTAFAVNMAQSMYKWGCMARQHGSEAVLFPFEWDNNAISQPEWEEFDGEFDDIHDGPGFLKLAQNLPLRIPCQRVPIEGDELLDAYQRFKEGDRYPLLQLLSSTPQLRHESIMVYGYHRFYALARALAAFDAVYTCSMPIPSYFSGAPYCAFSVGGDLQNDCGRADVHGTMMRLAFSAARFILASNPHTLGHCRRLGFSNALYLPYPMDDSRYAPGEGQARKSWKSQSGGDVFVLMTSRLDEKVKGQTPEMLKALFRMSHERPDVRFVFVRWGHSADAVRSQFAEAGLGDRALFLKPVGKKRLIDYYRSCDIVLDQFVYGYYGATMLEAAGIGKPIVMKMRHEHYHPLYRGDVAPIISAGSPDDVYRALLNLVDNVALRHERGKALRDWLVRNHGEDRTVPLMLAILRLTADRVALPPDLFNPLQEGITEEEKIYHRGCEAIQRDTTLPN